MHDRNRHLGWHTMSVLTGMRVVESSAFVAVPLAGMTLAQMGAEVIRVDHIGGGMDAGRWPLAPSGQSLFWAGLNKGKKSVAVDLRHPEGRDLVQRLATAPGPDAGMFLTNLPAKGWTDADTLHALRDDMITVTLAGDRHGRPQVDYTVNPSLGVTHMTGAEGSTDPVAHAVPAWDLVAGQMCVSTLLAAERHRLRTGSGQAAHLTLKDVAAAALGHLGLIGDVALNGQDRAKAGNALYGAYGQEFICRDGRRVMVIGLTARQWSKLLEVTDSQEAMAALERQLGVSLKDEGQRWRSRHAITQVLRPWFADRPVSAFADKFDAAGLTWSEVRTMSQALANDPDLSLDNPMFSAVMQPGIGAYLSPAHPVSLSQSPRVPAAAAPVLGAHTEEVLGDVLAMDDTEVAHLFDAGIVQSAEASRTAA